MPMITKKQVDRLLGMKDEYGRANKDAQGAYLEVLRNSNSNTNRAGAGHGDRNKKNKDKIVDLLSDGEEDVGGSAAGKLIQKTGAV